MRALYFILGLAVAATMFLVARPIVVCGNVVRPPAAPVPMWRTDDSIDVTGDIRLRHTGDGCPIFISIRTHSAINNRLTCKRT